VSTNFPGALDSLTNPLGSDSTAVVSHAAQHTNANDAIEALQVRVGITGSTDPASLTYRVSADGEGAAIAALTAKTTPVDADLVGLSDSAAGGVLKKLSWSSIKTALQSVFATLAGIAGGQTLIGGTGVTDKLTLQGTSGTGTAGATAINALVGDAGGTEAVTILNNGNVGIGNTNPSADLTVGADTFRVDGENIAIGSGASLGSVTTLLPVIAGGTITSKENSKTTVSSPSAAEAVRTNSMVVSPSDVKSGSPYKYGSVIDVSVPVGNTFSISNIYGQNINLNIDGTGSPTSVHGQYARNYFHGLAAGFLGAVYGTVYHAGSGVVSSANPLAGELTVSGGGTLTQGWGTEGYVTVSGNSTITTLACVAAGVSVSAGSSIGTAYGVSIGGSGDGWSNAGTITNCYALYIGSSTNVGTNKWSIYNQSPAVSYFAGSLALGVTAASAKVHAISTTEQLRLGYDASNYLSSTTGSTGKTTFTAVGTAPNLKWLMSDATTNAIYDLVTFSKNSSGAGAAGLGVRVNLAAKSSTTADTLVGAIDAAWVDATHASRKGRVKISAYDTAIRECIRAEASGTAAMLGFFGVTAVVQPTALTAQLTTLTYTAPSVADYAIQNLTSTGGFGFVTADEGNSVLAVIKNLQDRVAQLETKLQSLGLLT